jgi:hypothetical protein
MFTGFKPFAQVTKGILNGILRAAAFRMINNNTSITCDECRFALKGDG